MILIVLLTGCGTPEQFCKTVPQSKIDHLESVLERTNGKIPDGLNWYERKVIKNCIDRDQFKDDEPDQQPLPELDPPEIDQTQPTSFSESTSFLYTGEDPVQTGVDSGTIEARRQAVIRGKVLNENGEPLDRVEVSVLNHPEYGQTLSREDGMFSLAVNGGGQLTVQFEKDDYLPVQRPVQVPWRNYAMLNDDVVMTGLDENVTTVDLTEKQSIQVHQASVESDVDGSRQAILMFKPGTEAILQKSDGSTEPLSSIDVRATEYTVGERGPQAMPAPLPPTSAYTYAVELTAERTLDTPTQRIKFDQSVYNYVENFLGFPVGTPVPSGFYSRREGQWIPQRDGWVIQVVGESEGIAEVDVTGDGVADTESLFAEINLNDSERERLASLYDPGDSLWRVPINHFSPWDYNWPPADSGKTPSPSNPKCTNQGGETKDCPNGCCGSGMKPTVPGSSIDVQNQTVDETLPVVGTSLSLHYKSSRVSGYQSKWSLDIPLTGSDVPESLREITLRVAVAGKEKKWDFEPQPELNKVFQWDGTDDSGRSIQGPEEARIKIVYEYQNYYRAPSYDSELELRRDFGESNPSFGLTRNSEGELLVAPQEDSPRAKTTKTQTYNYSVGSFQSPPLKFGGWTLDEHHLYDPESKTLYRGDGIRRSAKSSVVSTYIKTVAGTGETEFNGDNIPAESANLYYPMSPIPDGKGGYYFADQAHHRVRYVNSQGVIRTVAGSGEKGFGGDGGQATEAKLSEPTDVALAPDGDLYIADKGNHRIRRVDSEGIIHTVVGTDTNVYNGDGIQATNAALKSPWSLDVDQHGNIYIADVLDNRVRKVTPDGRIHTFAGDGTHAFGGDGGHAQDAQFSNPNDVMVGPDGNVFIADTFNNRIRKVNSAGIIKTIFGGGQQSLEKGVLAKDIDAPPVIDIYVDRQGGIYIIFDDADAPYRFQVWYKKPGGSMMPIAGQKLEFGYSGDGGPPLQARFRVLAGVAEDSEGNILIADAVNRVIRKIDPIYPGVFGKNRVVASRNGARQFVFTHSGKHTRTLDARTGTVLRKFVYNQDGLLTTIIDRDGLETTIDRSSDGQAEAIVGPFGHRTELNTNEDGYLTDVTNPAGETYRMTYGDSGLIETFEDPANNQNTFTYTDLGRLSQTEDPAGAAKTFTRSVFDTGFTVTMKTAMNRSLSAIVEEKPSGNEQWTTVGSNNLSTNNDLNRDATQETKEPSGTFIGVQEGPDPRFNMMAPLTEQMVIRNPSGLELNIKSSEEVTGSSEVSGVETSTTTISINGQTFRSHYDSGSRTITRTTPEGRKSTVSLNDDARVAQQTTEELIPTTFTYNEDGQLVQSSQGNRTVTRSYNADGYVESVTDPLGRTTEYEYDPVGRVTRQVTPDGREITYQYDDNGNMTSLSPPGRSAHVFRYTSRDQREEYEPPSLPDGSTITTWTYNLDEQLTQIERPDLTTIDLSYDDAGRLDTMDFPADERTSSYDSSTGQLTEIEATNGADLSFNYDGPLTTEVRWDHLDVSGSVQYDYDNNFQVTDRTITGSGGLSGHTTDLSYDADGLLTQAGDLSLTRNVNNGLLEKVSLSSFQTSWTHNGFGEPVSRTTQESGSSLFSVDNTRDTAGRIVKETETVQGVTRTREYQYNEAGRLVQVTRNGDTTITYQYDANGNRLARIGPDDTTQGTYDAQDRLETYGDTSYQYNDAGQLTSKDGPGGQTTYDYDALGNLRSVEIDSDTTIEYIIDAQNRRVGKVVNGEFQQGFLYSEQLNPVAELDENGDIESVFIYGHKSNVPAYMIKNGTKYRIVSDHLGSVRAVVNVSTGNVMQRMRYDEFGRVQVDTKPGFQPFGFAGGIYDQHTGLVRFGARDYDPTVGRWTVKDPILFAGGSANLYGYVLNDPVNGMDPNGMIGQLHMKRKYHLNINMRVNAGGTFVVVDYSTNILTPFDSSDDQLSLTDPQLGGGLNICFSPELIDKESNNGSCKKSAAKEKAKELIKEKALEDPMLQSTSIDYGTGKYTGVSIASDQVCVNFGISVPLTNLTTFHVSHPITQ